MTDQNTSSSLFAQPLTLQWQLLFDRVTNRYHRTDLRRLLSWASIRGISPRVMTNTDFEAFALDIERAGLDRPRQLVGDAVRTWNKCRAAIPGWPDRDLRAPDTGIRKSLAFEELPLSFQQDVEAFLAKTSGDDLFDDRQMRPLSAATRRDRIAKFCQLATRFMESGRPLSSLNTLADLIAIEAIKDIFSKIWDEIGRQPNGHAHNLARLAALVARRWVNVPICCARPTRRSTPPSDQAATPFAPPDLISL